MPPLSCSKALARNEKGLNPSRKITGSGGSCRREREKDGERERERERERCLSGCDN